MKELSASQTYRLLGPGPIAPVTTSHDGKPNIMTMGFHMMIQHAPPLIGCITGPSDHSYSALRATGESGISGEFPFVRWNMEETQKCPRCATQVPMNKA